MRDSSAGSNELARPQMDVVVAAGLLALGSDSIGRSEPEPSAEVLQQSFPQYEILSLVGRGGMGFVYKAKHKGLHRLIALKLLPRALGQDPEFIARFEREARAMARLSHPHIVTVHDNGRSAEGQLFIAMEFVEGANLAELMRRGAVGRGDPISPEEKTASSRAAEPTPQLDPLEIVEQLCDALGYAHAEGIVHRDIKPANVLIDSRGHAKIADFGLARLAIGDIEHSVTTTGSVMGTIDYMAPEQRQGMKVDHRADIYSLGVMLYEMLTGRVPHGAFDPPSTRAKCDPRLDEIVRRAMHPEVERRYQSTAELKAAIADLRAHSPGADAPRADVSDRSRAKRLSHNLAVVAGPLVALTLAGAGWLAWKTGQRRLSVESAPQMQLGQAETPQFTSPNSSIAELKVRAASFDFVPPGPPGLVKTIPIQNSTSAIALVDGDRRALVPQGRAIELFDLVTGGSVWRQPYRSTGRLAVLPGEAQAITTYFSGGDLVATVFRVSDGTEVARWSAPGASGRSMLGAELSPDGQRLAIAFIAGEADSPPIHVRVIAPESLELVAQWDGPDVRSIYNLVWLDANRFLVGTGGPASPLAYDLRHPNQPPMAHPLNLFYAIAADKDREWFAGHRDSNLILTRRSHPEELFMLREKWTARELQFLDNGLLAACGVDNHTLLLWDVATRRLLTELHPEENTTNVAFSQDSRFAVVSGVKPASDPALNQFSLNLWRLRDSGAQKHAAATPAPVASAIPVDRSLGMAYTAIATATKDAPFVNSLGMKFVPVPITGGPTGGKRVLFSIWQTRVQDFQAFATENITAWRPMAWPETGVQGPTHPAVGVNWSEAEAFCAWLTEREHKAGVLGATESYRLPTNCEWLCAAGLGDLVDPSKSPGDQPHFANVYPWGNSYPPPPGSGNYADQTLIASGKKLPNSAPPIEGYTDGYICTAPVGSFAPNSFGIFDLGSNVREWCADLNRPGENQRVVRGASWSDAGPAYISLGNMGGRDSATRHDTIGFRVVLVEEDPAK